jgi:hypothetical protein
MSKSSKKIVHFGNSRPYTFTKEDLTCHICNNMHDETGFSNIKINKLARELKRYKGIGIRPKIICKNCTQQPRTHLKCFSCGITKLLAEYSKNQRGNNEIARCLDCIKLDYQEPRYSSEGGSSDTYGSAISNCSSNFIPLHKNSPSNNEYPINSDKSTAINSPLPTIYNDSKSLLQEIRYSSKFNTIPPYNLDTYSVYQLIGRKNHIPPSQEYILLNFSEIYENRDPICMNTEDLNAANMSSSQSITFPDEADSIKSYSITSYDENTLIPISNLSIHDITIDHISLLDKCTFCAYYKDLMETSSN